MEGDQTFIQFEPGDTWDEIVDEMDERFSQGFRFIRDYEKSWYEDLGLPSWVGDSPVYTLIYTGDDVDHEVYRWSRSKRPGYPRFIRVNNDPSSSQRVLSKKAIAGVKWLMMIEDEPRFQPGHRR